MLDTYLQELTAYGGDGNLYPWFDAYFREPECRWIHLAVGRSGTAGFAFVRYDAETGEIEMAEFFVMPRNRGRGVGTRLARSVLTRWPGHWRLQILAGNAPARAFWPVAIAAAGATDILCDPSGVMLRYRFRMPRA